MSSLSEPVTLLQGALAIESLSGREQAVAAYLVDAMRRRGYDRAFVDEAGNAIGEIGAPDAEHVIVLLGHMDTVPGRIPVRVEGIGCTAEEVWMPRGRCVPLSRQQLRSSFLLAGSS